MFLLVSGFYIINCNSRWIRTKSNHVSQRKGFTSDYFNSNQDCTRGKKVASTAITTTSTTTVVNTNIQPQVQSVKSSPFIILPKYIGSLKKTSLVSKEKKRKQAEKLEDFISYRRKSRYLFRWQVICRFSTGS